MITTSYKRQITDLVAPLIIRGNKDTNVYFMGSLSASGLETFTPNLSDVDLLIVPSCTSLHDYMSHFEQAINITAKLSKGESREWQVELFMMSSRIVYTHFSYLSVLAGSRVLSNENRLVIPEEHDDTVMINPAKTWVKSALYKARAAGFIQTYVQLLPVADTRKARKVSKLLMRGLKLIICAMVDADNLEATEDLLFSIHTFDKLESLFLSMTGIDLELDQQMQAALSGKTIDDWPAWMTLQDAIARKMRAIELDKTFSVNDSIFYDSIGKVLQDMLLVGVKNIISETNHDVRKEHIERYIEDTASLLVKLALSGVETLSDLESDTTPARVVESFDVIVSYLTDGEGELRTLAAAVILLEYAAEQSIQKAELRLL